MQIDVNSLTYAIILQRLTSRNTPFKSFNTGFIMIIYYLNQGSNGRINTRIINRYLKSLHMTSSVTNSANRLLIKTNYIIRISDSVYKLTPEGLNTTKKLIKDIKKEHINRPPKDPRINTII